jgi:hypothetical protein
VKLRNNGVTDAGAALLSQLLQREHHFSFDTLDLGGNLIGSAGTLQRHAAGVFDPYTSRKKYHPVTVL